ncbi:serine/threonine-protein kinase [Streptomyces collinus]|uniref:non-specific serine/threonine protein kinase n=1 Tax=Streptomyces collinus (strain DSM 40733 / Tue 365) TaxID=1214242 RepID=S5VBQ1_STRC3|nr:serine/threonine-protein kinase [Streptomyces collinus]AGS72609.1 serine/threonine protein kinase [Streptomyces collinus Tu 365]
MPPHRARTTHPAPPAAPGERRTAVERPTPGERPIAVEQSTPGERPIAVEQPTPGSRPAAEQPMPGERPTAVEQSAPGERPTITGQPAPGQPSATAERPVPVPVHAVAGVGELDQHGLVRLPDVPAPGDGLLVEDPRPLTGGRRCGANGCTMTVGVGYGGQPARATGRCPRCGTRYSFLPQLVVGDVVDGHYRVLGCLPRGGLGWVYLAEDTRADGHRVVLKGLIDAQDALARRNAVEERRSLTDLHHPDIVRLVTYAEHAAEGGTPTGYLVMDYIAGRDLQRLFHSDDAERIFQGRPRLDHVLTYGCMILGALQYMHERGLLYCDMKPSNVIHFGRAIKVVDLGAVRAIGDRTSAYVFTRSFAPPAEEIHNRGWHVDSDLYTVGTTLQSLAESAEPARGLAPDSFRRLVHRATHADPRARFRSAAEMSRQLWEVLREYRSLQFGEQLPEASTRFRATDAGLDAGLGAIPALDHWTARPGALPAVLDVSPPPPAEAAGALPAPVPDPDDGAALLLDTFSPDAPDRVARQWTRESRLGTPETALWLCRAYLRRGEQAAAESWLAEAVTLLGERAAGHDWRIAWHRGVLHLSRAEVRQAGECFEAVHRALPGEYVPKLALGHCAEHGGGPTDRVMPYYEAVWARDFAHTAAAFGLARGHLAAGDRDAAVRVLDDVPATSRHYDTARIAAVRIRAGLLAGRAPSPADLRDAERRLPELHLDGGATDGESRARLVAEVRENVLHGLQERAGPREFPTGDLLGPGTEDALRTLLEQSFRHLAGQARTADEHGRLLDLAHAVRPMTTF